MGILNITPDSFSDGGVHFDHAKALHAALQMEADGAAIIDIGGESTRPGAEPLAAQIEIDRVLPVIEQIRQRSGITISIDTRKAAVAEEAIRAGADIVNDVSGMRYSAGMPAVVATSGVPGHPDAHARRAGHDAAVRGVRRRRGGRRPRADIDDRRRRGRRRRPRQDPHRPGHRLRQDL